MDRLSLREECFQFSVARQSPLDKLTKPLRAEIEEVLQDVAAGRILLKSRGFNMSVLAQKVLERCRDKPCQVPAMARALALRLKELRDAQAKPSRRG